MKTQSKTVIALIVFSIILMLIGGCSNGGNGAGVPLAAGTADNPGALISEDSNTAPGESAVDSGSDPIDDATGNRYPLAHAGTGQTVSVNTLVDLDGSGSHDPDLNYPLTYSWQFIAMPKGSLAVLSGAQEPAASFVADLEGDYQIELVVTDSLGAVSDPSVVIISTINSAPVADAGPGQRFTGQGTIFLDGSQSFDPDGDPIQYAWVLIAKPAASMAALSGSDTVNPSFIADELGTYTVELVVTDSLGASSTPDTVVITSDNVAPVALAGYNQVVLVGDTVNLDGSGSYDADSDPITYTWSITSQPSGSTTQLMGANMVDPSFVSDVQGLYTLSLVVGDGLEASIPNSVTILAVDTAFLDDFIRALMQAVYAINQLEDAEFSNPNNRNALTNKIIAVLKNYLKGDYDKSMLDKLNDDIGGKMDGFILNDPPSLEPNDWIVTRDGQELVYPFIEMAASYLQDLLN
ncbi:MAG: PKD domain-containing protein [Deltaproteobacteria bacterium]